MKATALVVSHDPTFLAEVCTDVLSVEGRQLVHTAGGYASYEARREQRERRDAWVLGAAEAKEARLAGQVT